MAAKLLLATMPFRAFQLLPPPFTHPPSLIPLPPPKLVRMLYEALHMPVAPPTSSPTTCKEVKTTSLAAFHVRCFVECTCKRDALFSLKQSEQEAVRIAERLQGSVQLLEEHVAMLQADAQGQQDSHRRELERERLANHC